MKMNVLERMFFRATARRWNRVISSSLCQAYEAGVIGSRQMHLLAREFDPTQGGRVGRIIGSGENVRYTSLLIEKSRG